MPLFATEFPVRRDAGSEVRFLVDVNAPCNLRCTSCPRRGKGTPLEPDVALGLAERLAEQAEGSGADLATFLFFGGEPLLEEEALAGLVRTVKARVQAAGARFDARVVTNGTLLDGPCAARLAGAGFTRAQVTLAGPRELHDVRRRLDEGQPTYERILANVARARRHLRLVVRYEVAAPTDVARAPGVLRELGTRGLLDGPQPVETVMQRSCSYADQARASAVLDRFRAGQAASAARSERSDGGDAA